MTSLLQHTSDIPMRPISNKEMEVVDLGQLFEDWDETELLRPYSDSLADRSSSDDLAHLFDLPSSNESHLFGPETILDRDSWHKAVQRSEQNPASFMLNDSSSFCIDSRGKESLGDSELRVVHDLFELERNQLRSISQPSTPRPLSERSIKKAVSFNDRLTACGIQKPAKKSPAASFAKMMQPSYYRPTPDAWTRKTDTAVDSFHLRKQSNGITSPPLSSKIIQHENSNGFFSQHHHQPYTIARSPIQSVEPHAPGLDFSNYQITPQQSPAIGIPSNGSNPLNENMGLFFSSSSMSSAPISALQTPPSSLPMPITTWGPDTSPSLNFPFPTSPDFSGSGKRAGGWWNVDVSHQPSNNPTYRESNSRSTSQNMSLTNEAMSGLGISCDAAAFEDYGAVGLSVALESGEAMSGASASSFDMGDYSALYHTPPQQHIVSIGRPLSRSPSPCLQPRFHRRRPSSQSYASQHRTSQSSAASSRRKSSNSSQQSSRQPSTGNVGFVNFTPHDSRKILTGVAPSGSSKTKARREKEAADKRRKLSQAAMKAVLEAGGDVDSLRHLECEGLLVLES